MRLSNILILLFLLGALAIGSGISNSDISIVDSGINNASIAIQDISFQDINLSESESLPNVEGLLLVLERYIHFIGTFILEVFRAGIYFGNDNPEFFNPEFISQAIIWIVILLIISLLIQPVGYLLIFLIILGIFIKDKIKKRKHEKTISKDNK